MHEHECACHTEKIDDYTCVVTNSYMLEENIAWLTFKNDKLAPLVRPGNCVMVFPSASFATDPLLGRPFSIADADAGTGEISVCYVLRGKGTAMMSKFRAGDEIRVRGLFGVPLPDRAAKVYFAAGGVGIAIFLYYCRMFPDRVGGVYLGVRGKGYEGYAAKIVSLLPGTHLFADDGSFGEGDSMFAVLPKQLAEGEEVWACGPPGFIGAIRSHYASQPGQLYVMLEKRMACGYGGCLGCVVETKTGLKRLCVDQSLFSSDEVPDYEC